MHPTVLRFLFVLSLTALAFQLCGCGGGGSADTLPTLPTLYFSKKVNGNLAVFTSQPADQLAGEFSVSAAWDFGDGTTSTELNPHHFFSEPGGYAVSVTYQLGDGRRVSYSEQVAVDIPLQCAFDWQHVYGPSPWVFNDLVGSNGFFVGVGAGGNLHVSKNGFIWCEVVNKFSWNFTRVLKHQQQFYALGHRAYFDDNGDPKSESVLLTSSNFFEWPVIARSDSLLTDVAILGSEIIGVGRRDYVSSNNQSLVSTGVIERFNRTTDRFELLRTAGETVEEIRTINQELWLRGKRGEQDGEPAAFFVWKSDDAQQWQISVEHPTIPPQIPRGSGTRLVNLTPELVYLQDDQWITASLPDTVIPDRLFFAGERFFVWAGDRFYTSRDGRGWVFANQTPRPDHEIIDVAFNGAVWHAISDNGQLLWSHDGVRWHDHPESQHPRQAGKLNHIAHTSDGFAVVGDGGVVLRSTNGRDWQTTILEEGANLYAAVQTSAGLLVAGERAGRVPGSVWKIGGDNPVVHAKQDPITHLAANSKMVVAVTRRGQVERSRDPEARFWESTEQVEVPLSLQVFDDDFYLITNTGRLLKSSDGRQWNEVRFSNFSVQTFSGGDGVKIVAGTSYATDPPTAGFFRADDNGDWLYEALPYAMRIRFAGTDLYGFTLVGNRFVISNSDDHPPANYLFSPDGSVWTPQTSPPVLDFVDLRVTQFRALAIDNQGRLFLRDFQTR